jgi:fused signal recognition particle receptor
MARSGGGRTFGGRLRAWFARTTAWREADFDALEDTLLEGDFGPRLAAELVDEVRVQRPRNWEQLQLALEETLQRTLTTTVVMPRRRHLTVVLMLGVNGVGKTTALAKLAHRFQRSYAVMFAAADTFRAAAIEQLVRHGERLGLPVIRQARGADAAAVAYDAISSARARGSELLLVDTAGRMHNRADLVAELRKLARVSAERVAGAGAVHHLLAVDATTGQNAIEQARVFHDVLRVDSLLLTKFDSSARGGTAFAVSRQLGLPFSLLGTGEGMDDLEPFDGQRFAAAVVGRE